MTAHSIANGTSIYCNMNAFFSLWSYYGLYTRM